MVEVHEHLFMWKVESRTRTEFVHVKAEGITRLIVSSARPDSHDFD